MQGDGLQVLSGEKHVEIEKQIAAAEAARLALQGDNAKTEKMVNFCYNRALCLHDHTHFYKEELHCVFCSKT